MPDIKIEKAEGTWTVRAGGAILVESKNAQMVMEADHPSTIYFPRKDIAMAFLDDSDHRTICPKKGEANYYSIITKSQTLSNAAWSYESPREMAEQIKDHLAFEATDDVKIERI